MARKFRELEEKLPLEVRERVQKRVQQTIAELPLHRLRSARELTQKQLAETLRVDQPAISRLERRTDMYLSTLRHFIEAMNGQLVIQAVFPDGRYTIIHLRGEDEANDPG